MDELVACRLLRGDLDALLPAGLTTTSSIAASPAGPAGLAADVAPGRTELHTMGNAEPLEQQLTISLLSTVAIHSTAKAPPSANTAGMHCMERSTACQHTQSNIASKPRPRTYICSYRHVLQT
jgi:hypothetical protein